MAKVSILMNGYNCEAFLKEAIDSVYQQTYTDWEIIFVDNCSTDNTSNIIKKYDNKIRYYKTEETIPLGKARNFGLQFCNGDYVAFLDTDDVWISEKLKKQLEVMEANKEFKMCYTSVIYIDEFSKEIGRLNPKAKSGNVFAQQLRRYEINMQSVLLKNDIPIKFNDSMEFSPDFDLFMKIASNYKTVVLNDYLIKYRKLSNSLTSKKISRWWVETKQTLDDIFENEKRLTEYEEDRKFAYAKVNYYRARYLMTLNNKKDAKKVLSEFKYLSLVYFLIYLLGSFPSLWNYVHKR